MRALDLVPGGVHGDQPAHPVGPGALGLGGERGSRRESGRGEIPLGLGARHAAAASITATTQSIAMVVSQTSGAVRLFKEGNIVLELHQSARRT